MLNDFKKYLTKARKRRYAKSSLSRSAGGAGRAALAERLQKFFVLSNARSSQSAGGAAALAEQLQKFFALSQWINMLNDVKKDLTKARKRPPPDQVGAVSCPFSIQRYGPQAVCLPCVLYPG